jgi:glycosyltransferase involved in cell wall biosynthesis
VTSHAPLFIVGNDGGTNIGASLLRAANALGIPAELADARAAYDAPRAVARFNWWVRGRRPTRLGSFSESVAARWRDVRPSAIISTGLAPLDARTLEVARQHGLQTTVYLTDDPWNPAFKSQWFLDALPLYDRVFTPRRSNIADLIRHGCRFVEFLPFGFDDELFFPDPPPASERSRYAADVFFAGGADSERRPFLAALVARGFDVALYGDYWERFAETRAVTRGHGTPKELRHAIAASKVCLGLVRRANRDGHAMRSIEVPAAGGCFLVERTGEHEEIFGPDNQAVAYFNDIDDMVRQLRRLLEDDSLRQRLATRAHEIIEQGHFTYEDRLLTLIGTRAETPGPIHAETR